MMKAATKLYVTRLLTVFAVCIALIATGLYVRYVINQREQEIQTKNLLANLWQNRPEHVEEVLQQLDVAPDFWKPIVESVASSETASLADRTRAWLALVKRDSQFVSPLSHRLLTSSPSDHQLIVNRLSDHQAQTQKVLWSLLNEPRLNSEMVQAASVLASFAPDAEQWSNFGKPLAAALAASDPLLVNTWLESLYPVRGHLHQPLFEIVVNTTNPMHERLMAIGVLSYFGRLEDSYLDPALLCELVLTADDPLLSSMDEALLQRKDKILPLLLTEIKGNNAKLEVSTLTGEEKQRIVQRSMKAVLTASLLGDDLPLTESLAATRDPSVRTELIDHAQQWKLSASKCSAIMQHPSPATRQAVLLGILSYWEQFDSEEKKGLLDRVVALHQSDIDSGVHSAADLVLRRLNHDKLAELNVALQGKKIGNWQLLSNGLMLISVAPPGKIQLGSSAPLAELGIRSGRRTTVLEYPYTISATEITVEQYEAFDNSIPHSEAVTQSRDCPMSRLNVYQAMKFCRWLSEQQSWFEADNCCYPPIAKIGPSMQLQQADLRKPGFRLPTIDEWEFAARAGSITEHFFGDTEKHLDDYSWWVGCSNELLWPVAAKRPNGLGLFDIHGNVREWVHDSMSPLRQDRQPIMGGDYRSSQRFHASAVIVSSEADSQVSTNGFRVVCIKTP